MPDSVLNTGKPDLKTQPRPLQSSWPDGPADSKQPVTESSLRGAVQPGVDVLPRAPVIKSR